MLSYTNIEILNGCFGHRGEADPISAEYAQNVVATAEKEVNEHENVDGPLVPSSFLKQLSSAVETYGHGTEDGRKFKEDFQLAVCV